MNHIHTAQRKETGLLHGMPWVICHCDCGAYKFDDEVTWHEENMTLETLDQIGCETNTDKSSRALHDYLRTYDELLSPIRHEPVKLLEMGVLGGDSLLMWSRYFTHPETRIIGIDIETHRCQKIDDPRVGVCQDSQADPGFWNRCDDRRFDLIVDDGSHFLSHQKEAFRLGWCKVKPGGLWVVEDLHVYASPQHCDIEGENVMQWLTDIATQMQGKGADAAGRVEATDRWCSISQITFRKGMAILRKAR
jgi:hypothetical protein